VAHFPPLPHNILYYIRYTILSTFTLDFRSNIVIITPLKVSRSRLDVAGRRCRRRRRATARNGPASRVEEDSFPRGISRVGAAASMCPSDNVELRLRARAANNRDVSNRNYYIIE